MMVRQRLRHRTGGLQSGRGVSGQARGRCWAGCTAGRAALRDLLGSPVRLIPAVSGDCLLAEVARSRTVLLQAAGRRVWNGSGGPICHLRATLPRRFGGLNFAFFGWNGESAKLIRQRAQHPRRPLRYKSSEYAQNQKKPGAEPGSMRLRLL